MFRDEFKLRYTTIPLAIHRAECPFGAEELLAHRHREIELIYMREGRLNFYVDTVPYTLLKGDILVVPPYAIHRIPAHREGRAAHDCICFSASLLPDVDLQHLLEGGGRQEAWHVSAEEAIRFGLDACVSTAFSASAAQEDGWELTAVGCLSVLFGYLKRCHAFVKKEERAGDGEFAYRVIASVDAQFAEVLTSHTLADALHLSQSHFCRRFKEVFGTSFERYLLLYRLERARILLRQESFSVTEVAYRTGFHSASYFGKQFRERYGVSPLSYQKTERAGEKEEKNLKKHKKYPKNAEYPIDKMHED